MKWLGSGIACIGLVVFSAACDNSPKVIDPFPIVVNLSSGPVLLKAQEGDGEVLDIVVDVLSPITILDHFRPGDAPRDPKRHLVELTLWGATETPIPRFRFPQTTAYDLHTCAPSEALCMAGQDESTHNVYGVLGTDILSRSSVRFSFTSQQLRFFPDAAGSDSERTLSCDAVFSSPFVGGGTLRIAGSEVRFGGWRPTLGACIHTETISEPAATQSERGTDLHMAISTAFGATLLTEDAYERYSASGIAPSFETLPTSTVYLPSGPIQGRRAEIPFLALTGNAGGDSDGRGPCRELYANARMRNAKSCSDDTVDCPCAGSADTCKAAAAVELSHSVSVLVVPANLSLLQTLRDELRPQRPELDGILGVQALRSLEIEFDYPNNRLLMRCEDLATCITRPQVRSQSTLPALDTCRELEQGKRDSQQVRPDAGVIP